jgi:hypothetical protein
MCFRELMNTLPVVLSCELVPIRRQVLAEVAS